MSRSEWGLAPMKPTWHESAAWRDLSYRIQIMLDKLKVAYGNEVCDGAYIIVGTSEFKEIRDSRETDKRFRAKEPFDSDKCQLAYVHGNHELSIVVIPLRHALTLGWTKMIPPAVLYDGLPMEV